MLDNCMGSGSTGIACIHTNRDFIGFELDETYYKLAEERIKNIQNGLTDTVTTTSKLNNQHQNKKLF